MTVEVKKGSFEIKGTPLELWQLEKVLLNTNFHTCHPNCQSCIETHAMIKDLYAACNYSKEINHDELISEINRLAEKSIENGKSQA